MSKKKYSKLKKKKRKSLSVFSLNIFSSSKIEFIFFPKISNSVNSTSNAKNFNTTTKKKNLF